MVLNNNALISETCHSVYKLIVVIEILDSKRSQEKDDSP